MQVRQSIHVRRPVLATAMILAAGTLLGACERADPNQHALATGSAKLQANSGGAYATPYDAFQSRNYKDTIAIAKPIASGDTKSPQAAAASALVGTAQLGMSLALLDEAALLEQAAVNRATLLRVLLDNWVAYSMSADTAQGFDPTEILARIDKDRAERDREVQGYQSKLQDVERRLADLRAGAKSKFEEADKYALEFAKARESLASLTASEAETRLTSAREDRRRGDAIRVDASRLQAQADVTQPEADELKVLIAATQNRVASLDREKLEISERAQQGRAASAQSRSSAAETAKQIETALTELASSRSSGVIAKYDEAIASLRAAAASAKAASSDPSVGGKILVGRTQLALAGAYAAKASSVKSFASFLHHLAVAVPPLPFAASLDAPQKEAAELIRQTSEDAKSAFEAAQSAFSSVQLRGQGAAAIKDRMTQLSEAIGALAGQTKAPEVPANAAPATEQPAQPPAAESAPPAAAATPDAAWEQMYAAMESGDKAAFMSFVKLDDPGQEAVISGILVLSNAQRKLDAATKAKFGKSFSEFQAAAMGVTAPTKASDFKIETAGDTATVSHPASPSPIKLVRENGKWLVSSASIAAGPAAAMAPMAAPIGAAMDSVTVDVEGGKITKIEDVLMEVQKRAAAAMKSGGG